MNGHCSRCGNEIRSSAGCLNQACGQQQQYRPQQQPNGGMQWPYSGQQYGERQSEYHMLVKLAELEKEIFKTNAMLREVLELLKARPVAATDSV